MKNLFYIFFIAFFLSCSNDSESDLIDDEDPTGPITYESTIKSIINSNCLGCHSDPTRNGAPFPLANYEQVLIRAQNGSLLRAISKQSGEPVAMPPAGRLPQNTIDLIEQWINEGALEE